MLRALFSLLGGLFTLLVTGLLFVALIAGGVLWMYSRDLPNHEELALYAPKTISRVYSGEGQIIDEFAAERRIFVPAEDIPPLVKEAFFSAEDKNFYEHHGYDLAGIAKAAFDAAQGGRLRGASTITQQVMKNFLLSSDRSIERKMKEILLAARVEQALSKDKILELYLNEIFLGSNSYGVAAAAQSYFNKTLDELEPHEAAYLAALPKAPSNYHPVYQKDAALQRRNFVLREMHENGYLDTATFEAEREKPLRTVQNGDFPSFRRNLPPRDYFTDEIRRQLSGDFGKDEFFGGGLAIRATVDPDLQFAAAKSLRKALEDYDRSLGVWRKSRFKIPPEQLDGEDAWRAALGDSRIARDIDLDGQWFPAVVLDIADQAMTLGVETVSDPVQVPRDDIGWIKGNFFDNFEVGDVVHVRRMTKDGEFLRWSLRQVPRIQGAFVAMDVHTGRVLAMQGGFSYQSSVFNRATQATRQPGSAFKPFVYAAALDSGYTPATIVIDAPIEIDTAAGIWRPKNASNRFYGPTPLRTGIERSRNLMTVRLAQEVGMDTVARYAEDFGVYDHLGRYLANALGSQETTLYKMVSAYSMFANGGERVEPTLVDRVQDRWGATIYRHDQRLCPDCEVASLQPGLAPRIVSNRKQAIDAITAYQLTSMMKGVVERGTAASTVGAANLGVPVAGKTGTTNDAKDVWFVGFTSNIAAGCYMGYDQPRPLGSGASGGGMCGPVFTRFMKEAIAKYGGGPFAVPEGGYFVNIDRYTGSRLPDGARGENVVAEYFRVGEDPFFGTLAYVDGGFAMGANVPMFSRGENDDATDSTTVTTSTGKKVEIAPKASFGSMSSGGLY
ncbi:penicillin-binding protein 1A [Tropicimonas isoalkanivorans]|uniref:Penicillin-binding protein 1A n=1 Tax=Tropicimonas isoalkanivorans TaxID=441112 RepID=A0A1I1E4N7_9RHOB|nr:PBP1A family penicillin-binding protein [Tropicimonas isoalkanivorans]SFB81636.1 penicillin-binding protein 1A [Tropicimonas isoalkanivorans]